MSLALKYQKVIIWGCTFLVFPLFISFAINYNVDSTNGPETLEQDIKTAFEQWSNVEGGNFRADLNEEASTLITYGDREFLGPDVVSLGLSKLEDGEQNTIILFNPDSNLLSTAFLHETGSLAGLSVGEGIMNPKLTANSPIELSDSDKQALVNLALLVPEDINRDGEVNFYDLFELSKVFGPQGINTPADINKDGTVDEEDLDLLKAAYTFSSPARNAKGNLEATQEFFEDEDTPEYIFDEEDLENPTEDPTNEESLENPTSEENIENSTEDPTNKEDIENPKNEEDLEDSTNDLTTDPDNPRNIEDTYEKPPTKEESEKQESGQ